MGKLLVILGLVIAAVGAAMWLGVPLGRLPGDIVVRRGAFTFYFPLTTWCSSASCSRSARDAAPLMIRPYRSIRPRIDPSAFIDPSAQVIGDVEMGEESSAWMNVVIRGDVNWIRYREP